MEWALSLIADSARPMPKRKFRKNDLGIEQWMAYRKGLRCRNNEWLKVRGASTNQQMVVDMRMKWHEKIHAEHEPMNQWMSEFVSRWTNEPMHQRIADSVNQWMSELVSRWFTDASTNRWFSEPMNVNWVDEPMNPWKDEVVSRGVNESMKQWIN